MFLKIHQLYHLQRRGKHKKLLLQNSSYHQESNLVSIKDTLKNSALSPLHFFFLLSLASIACKNQAAPPPISSENSLTADTITVLDTAAYRIRMVPKKHPYTLEKQAIATEKAALKRLYESQKISLDSVQNRFEELLLNGIIPYWYGMPWSFEGHTAEPNKGEIACGYFVSTTLLHVGLAINRYKLAQKSPEDEANSLKYSETVQIIEGESTTEIIEKILKKFQSGLLFVGLDESHVGYLLIRDGELFFIHSNYSSPSEVVLELASHSGVFSSFYRFYIVPLSRNEGLIMKWL